mmetsp:Transcript_38896/g.97277  ORF Transcript_38896/g.97277 Transcript_38896/m.97277 type:complete len:300 (+) Transcript_38896:165-1064(+)
MSQPDSQRALRRCRERSGQGAGLAADLPWKERLAREGCYVQKVTNDGNCLFRAFADQLTGDESGCSLFRQKAMDYVEQHRPDFEHFIAADSDGLDRDEKFDAYVRRMRVAGEWGGELEITSLCHSYEVNCLVHQKHLATPIDCDYGYHKRVQLLYDGGSHYDSVRRDDCGGRAADKKPAKAKGGGKARPAVKRGAAPAAAASPLTPDDGIAKKKHKGRKPVRNKANRKPVAVSDDYEEGEGEWEVDRIVDHRQDRSGNLEFKVVWKPANNGQAWEPMWEPEDNCDDCRDAVVDYWASKA